MFTQRVEYNWPMVRMSVTDATCIDLQMTNLDPIAEFTHFAVRKPVLAAGGMASGLVYVGLPADHEDCELRLIFGDGKPYKKGFLVDPTNIVVMRSTVRGGGEIRLARDGYLLKISEGPHRQAPIELHAS